MLNLNAIACILSEIRLPWTWCKVTEGQQRHKISVELLRQVSKQKSIKLATTLGHFLRDLHFANVYMAWESCFDLMKVSQKRKILKFGIEKFHIVDFNVKHIRCFHCRWQNRTARQLFESADLFSIHCQSIDGLRKHQKTQHALRSNGWAGASHHVVVTVLMSVWVNACDPCECALRQFAELCAMVTMGTAPIKVLHSFIMWLSFLF